MVTMVVVRSYLRTHAEDWSTGPHQSTVYWSAAVYWSTVYSLSQPVCGAQEDGRGEGSQTLLSLVPLAPPPPHTTVLSLTRGVTLDPSAHPPPSSRATSEYRSPRS